MHQQSHLVLCAGQSCPMRPVQQWHAAHGTRAQITKRDDLPKQTISLAASMLKDTKQQVAYFQSYLAEH